MEKGAVVIKPYRFMLYRIWDRKKPLVLYIMLNPSKADETQNDPTIRRCISFAKSHGYGGFYVGNLFPFRSSDPLQLRTWFRDIGFKNVHQINGVDILAHNRHWISSMKENCKDVIFAWGNNGQYYPKEVKRMIIKFPQAKCFGQTGIGMPMHPLMLPSSQQLVDFKYNIINKP